MRRMDGKWVAGLVLLVVMICSIPAGAEASGLFRRQVPSVVSEILKAKAAVSKMTFTQSSYSIKVGAALDMEKRLSISPKSAGNKRVVWSSSDQAIIKVDELGRLTALQEGAAMITAVSEDNPLVSACCTVSGKAVRVSGASVSEANVTLDVGGRKWLSVKVSPSNATYPGVRWVSSDETVAVVDEYGGVKAVGSGIAKVTAWTDRGRKGAAATVRVRGGDMKVIKLSAVGDMVLGGDTKKVPKADKPIRDGLTSYTRFRALYNRYGREYFMGAVQHIFQQDDVTVVNFEGTLTDSSSAQSKTFAFKGPKSYREIAKSAGIDVACLANNHTMDFGTGGYKDTVRALNGIGIANFGNGRYEMTTYVTNGVKIGFVGFTLPVSTSNVEKGIKTLRKNKGCDIVVVSYHWTKSKEWKSTVSGEERTFARYAVSKGADLVLGHHKHVVSGIEEYKGKMIVYDLGNFVAVIRNTTDDGKLTDKDSMIYQQKFNVFRDGYVECVEPNIIPCMNSDVQDALTGNVHLLNEAEGERVLSKIRNRTPSSSRHLVKTIEGY